MTRNLSDFLQQLIHRREAVRQMTAVGLGFVLDPALSLFGKNSPRRQVLFFTKSSGYEHSSIKRNGNELSHAERILTKLGTSHGFDVTASKDGSVFTGENLKRYDAIFFYTTGDLTQAGTDKNPPMSKEGKTAFLEAIRSGKGFLATHSASDTFHSVGEPFHTQAPDARDPYIQMLGGEFIRHGEQQEANMKLASAHFPGCEKIKDGFRLKDEWYSLKNFASDLHVILVQDTKTMQGSDYQRPDYPATWARHHGKGRVFYTSMGHREDVWTNPTFQSVVVGAIAWATGNVNAKTPPNLKTVTPQAETIPPKPAKE
jgi:type 1 glutamine amidotransferase